MFYDRWGTLEITQFKKKKDSRSKEFFEIKAHCRVKILSNVGRLSISIDEFVKSCKTSIDPISITRIFIYQPEFCEMGSSNLCWISSPAIKTIDTSTSIIWYNFVWQSTRKEIWFEFLFSHFAGFEKEPKLAPNLAPSLHKLILMNNLNPVKVCI